MLILTRKSSQCIMIGDDIKITVLSGHNGNFRIGIDAPRDLPVHREEIYNRIDNIEKEVDDERENRGNR